MAPGQVAGGVVQNFYLGGGPSTAEEAPAYPDLSLLGICRLHTSLQFLSRVCCLFQLPESRRSVVADVVCSVCISAKVPTSAVSLI